jgi:hypothetical protein
MPGTKRALATLRSKNEQKEIRKLCEHYS